jgi:hypothetical protein
MLSFLLGGGLMIEVAPSLLKPMSMVSASIGDLLMQGTIF